MPTTFFTHLRCPSCKREFERDQPQTFCGACNGPIEAMYDLAAAAKALSPSTFAGREGTLWRYRELLPVVDDRHIMTLGEGWTPILKTPRLGGALGVPGLMIKEEAYNPTGSFKARGIAVAVSKAVEFGITSVALPSAGNAGGALAAYAARAGIGAHVFIPTDTPIVNREEVGYYGARSVLVEGLISDAAAALTKENADGRYFDMSTMKEPYRLEGKKTMGYELAEQCGWKPPDVVLYPTGGGTGLVGMWKAFGEMSELGWLRGPIPRLISVQAAGCAPIVRAFEAGDTGAPAWPNASTLASGLRVPKAFADRMILEAIRLSKGTAIAVEDTGILAALRQAAALEGILLCPEGAATVAALPALLERGAVKPEERVLVYNTGSGYKYREVLEKLDIV